MGQTGSSGTAPALEDRYYIGKVVLGSGSFGTVFGGVDKQTHEQVAVKRLDKSTLPQRKVTREDIKREITMMQASVHENITKLYDKFEDDKYIYLALELCDRGDLGDKVKERALQATEPEVAEYMRQMCSAIACMHARGRQICHRDIKPDNFMLQAIPDKPGQFAIKLSDFGLAIYVHEGELLTSKCGTPAFMAPEQMNLSEQGSKKSNGYSFPVDLWAVGVSMYMMMLGGKHPFLTPDGNNVDKPALMAARMDFTDPSQTSWGPSWFTGSNLRFSDQARTFCRLLVCTDPKQRITAEVALQNPWFQQQCGRNGAQGVRPPAAARQQEAALELDKTMLGPSARRDSNRSASPSVPSRGIREGEREDAKAMSRQSGPGETTDPKESQAALEQAAKVQELIQEENRTLRLRVEEERKKREEEKKLQQQRMEMQERLLHRQKQKELEEQKAQLEAQKAAELAAATAATAATAAASSSRSYPSKEANGTPAFSRSQTRHMENQAAQGGNMSGAGVLTKDMKCRYESDSYGMIEAVVLCYNDFNGTYDLSVRKHAAVDKIAPPKGLSPAEAWPPGLQVSYLSAQAQKWYPTKILSYNEGDSTYNLVCREHADVDRIRAWLDRPPDRPGENDSEPPRRSGAAMATQEKHFQDSPSMRRTSTGGEDDGRRVQTGGPGGVMGTSPASSVRSVSKGDFCMTEQHGLVEIQDVDWRRGEKTYVVKARGQKLVTVTVDVLRAPGDKARMAWPVGTQVSYQSTSVNKWVEAHVVSFNEANGKYNLDVRPEAAPERIRPR